MPDELRFCKFCGAPLEADMKVCAGCGQSVEGSGSPMEYLRGTPDVPSAEPPAMETPAKPPAVEPPPPPPPPRPGPRRHPPHLRRQHPPRRKKAAFRFG